MQALGSFRLAPSPPWTSVFFLTCEVHTGPDAGGQPVSHSTAASHTPLAAAAPGKRTGLGAPDSPVALPPSPHFRHDSVPLPTIT